MIADPWPRVGTWWETEDPRYSLPWCRVDSLRRGKRQAVRVTHDPKAVAPSVIPLSAFVGAWRRVPPPPGMRECCRRKLGQMQCKDVPDLPVLRFLASLNGEWANNWIAPAGATDREWAARSVYRAMLPGTPWAVVVAKMRRLIERGLVDGCPCGCRGDYVITDKGRAYLAAHTPAVTP